jgi:hypothetical protein
MAEQKQVEGVLYGESGVDMAVYLSIAVFDPFGSDVQELVGSPVFFAGLFLLQSAGDCTACASTSVSEQKNE